MDADWCKRDGIDYARPLIADSRCRVTLAAEKAYFLPSSARSKLIFLTRIDKIYPLMMMIRNLAPTTARVARASVPRFTAAFAGRRFYHDKVLDHYNNPRNVGSLDKTLKTVGTGLVGAPACGDVMKLQIDVDDSGVIRDVKFKTFGCGSAIASSSYMTELVRGMTLDEAGKVKNTTIAKELSLPPVKLHCSMLAEDAIKSAIKDFRSKNPTLGPDAAAAKTAAPAPAAAETATTAA